MKISKPVHDKFGNRIAYVSNINNAPGEKRMVYVEDDGTVNIGVDALAWGVDEFDQDAIDRVNRLVTALYENTKKKWVVSKARKIERSLAGHWYMKEGILRDKIIAHTKTYAKSIIEDYIMYNPSSVLIPYYKTLIARVETIEPRYVHLMPAKVLKLPQYDEYNDNLIGSKTKFLNLIVAIYPPKPRGGKSYKATNK